ncbi:MAG: 5-histidylcysteine sulfoxide synthase [Campylobacterales bacterium]|nr:5-histidylcysteine sulfoxide synthase [Campylobacterales bacterium]
MQSLLPPTLIGSDTIQKRREILDYFRNSYTLFESLFDLLADDEVYYRQSEPTRHPMIFYFGHTAVFYVNKLMLAGLIKERIDPHFESIFAIGVDEMVWDDMNDPHHGWPEVDEVRAYRAKVRALVESLIETLPLHLPISQEEPFWAILMGCEHERIHIETSSVLHRQMPLELIREDARFVPCTQSAIAPLNDFVRIEAGTVELGKGKEHHLYGWDNEYGVARMEVAAFETTRYLISNGEFLPFVEEGGYETMRFWDEEGRRFLQLRGAKHPAFWVRDGALWRLRVLDRLIDLALDWPVEVNYLEAMAYCRWRGERENTPYRLPSEAEWMRLRDHCGLGDLPQLDVAAFNLNLERFASPCPVNRFTCMGIGDVTGNVWQWTQTPIDGFEGFAPHPLYDDFSTPTFDGKHNLMKGGSFISTGNELMRHARYAFRRHFYQHAGFRILKGEAVSFDENVYESDALVAQYCGFQWGDDYFDVENFATKCARLAIGHTLDIPVARALDLGCATGRASFELARHFESVTGIDFSARFIQVATRMQEQGAISYERIEEGVIKSIQTQSLEALELLHVRDKVSFWQGDACNLKPQFTGYNLIMATNLIDRLYDPALFLRTIHERLEEEGILVLTSPYTWLEEYTPKERWIGGYVDEQGNEVRTLEGLKTLLREHFELIDTHDVAFVIRESARKFQHSIAQMSVWKKLSVEN